MIPDERFSLIPIPGVLLNPWSMNARVSNQWGPVALQDPSQGLVVKVWTATAIGLDVWVESPDNPPVLMFTRANEIFNVNLAFDGSGFPCLAFQEVTGTSYFYWWDPLPGDYVFFTTAGMEHPRCTLDDARETSSDTRDVILGYVRAGAIRYRQLRDRYTIEYTPTVGDPGPPVSADILYNISMNSVWRLEFLYGHLPKLFASTDIMKKQILQQKSPVELLDVTFNFYHTMMFGEVIETAAVVITVESGEDADPSSMLVVAPTHDDTNVTQQVQGGIPGVVYRIAMSARTANNCVYVVEGLLYVNDSPAIEPPDLP